MIKVYLPNELYKIETNFGDRINDKDFIESTSKITLLDSINNADIIINPVSWNTYLKIN